MTKTGISYFIAYFLSIGILLGAPHFTEETLGIFSFVDEGESAESPIDLEKLSRSLAAPRFAERDLALRQMRKLPRQKLSEIASGLAKLGSRDPEIRWCVASLKQLALRKESVKRVKMLDGDVNISTGMPTIGGKGSQFITDGDWSTEANPRSSRFSYGLMFESTEKPELYEIRHLVINWGVYAGYYLKNKIHRQGYISEYTIQYLSEGGKWEVLHAAKQAPSEEKHEQIKLFAKKADPYYTGTFVAHYKLEKPLRVRGVKIVARSSMHWIKLLELEVYGNKVLGTAQK